MTETSASGNPDGRLRLRDQAATAVKWSFVGIIGKQGIRFLFVLFLARLIGPESFGITAQALTFITFVSLFLDQGIGATVIQRRDLTPLLIGSVFWLNAVTTLIFVATTFFGAPIIAEFFGTPQLTSLLRVLALDVLFLGFDVMPRALLSRALRFRRVASAEIIGAVVGGVVGIVAAVNSAGAWSLVIQVVVTDGLVTLLLLMGRETFYFRASWQALRSVWRFSLQVLGFSVINYAARNLDNVFVGKYLGAKPLAFYSLSYRTLMVPVLGLGQVANRVALPVYARVQHDAPRVRRTFLLGIRVIALVSFPMMTLVIVEAPKAVHVVLGSAWGPAVIPMQLLALTGLRQSVQSTLGPVLLAVGRADLQLYWGLGSSLLYVASFIIGLQWGIVGVAASYTIVGFLIAPISVAMLARALGFQSQMYYRSLIPAVIGSGAMVGVGLISTQGLAAIGMGDFEIVIMTSALAIAAFWVVIRIFWPSEFSGATALFRVR